MENARRATSTRTLSTPSRFETDFSFHVPPPEDGDSAAAEKVIASLFERTRTSVGRAAKRSAELSKVVTNWQEALVDRIGPDTWRRFVEYSRQQRTTNYGVADTRSAPRRIATAKKEAWQRSLELMKEANVDRETVLSIHAQANERLLSSLGRDTGVRRTAVVRVVDVPPAVLKAGTSGSSWFVKTQPYDGWSWTTEAHQGGGGKLSSLHSNNKDESLVVPYITGQFGHYSRYENYDASNWDALWLAVQSDVGFWYKAPEPGQRQVWVHVRCKRVRAGIYLEDEYGFSGSGTSMFSRLYFDVVQVPGLEGQTEDLGAIHYIDEPDSKWHTFDLIAPEEEKLLPFVANFPPDWVYIRIGSDDLHVAIMNDVSTDQGMDTVYIAEQVSIEE